MAEIETITMSMREIDRLKTIQAVVDGNMRAVTVARQLQLSRRQVDRLTQRLLAQGPAGLVSRKHGQAHQRLSARDLNGGGEIFGDPVIATALLDRLSHHAIVAPIEGNSYQLREHAALIPEHLRSRTALDEMGSPAPAKRRPGRPKRKETASMPS